MPSELVFSTSADGAESPTARVTINSSGDLIINSTGGTLQTATAGTSNLRLGVNAGDAIQSGGNYNVLIGDQAGSGLTTGDLNVAVGYEALEAEDAHGENVAVGARTLKT